MFVLVTVTAFFLTIFMIALIATVIAAQVLQRRQGGVELDGSGGGLLDLPFLLKEQEGSSISPWAAVLQRFDFIPIIRARTIEADLDWSVGRVSAMMLLSGTVTLALLSGFDLLPGIAQIVFGIGAAMLPY